jgi:probable phosphoglycerate mutase
VLILVLTRHGLTPLSKPEQHLGQRIDIELSPEGRRQAQKLAIRLRGVRFDRIITSPLVRARETAEIVAGDRDIPLEYDPRLKEMDYGHWEGLTYEQIAERDAAYRARWEEDPANLPCPGGESGRDVAARAHAFLTDLLTDHVARHGAHAAEERPVLAVGHSSTNRILCCVAIDIEVREYRQRLVQSQANVTVLRFEHGDGPSDARLVLLNDIAHLRPPAAQPWE